MKIRTRAKLYEYFEPRAPTARSYDGGAKNDAPYAPAALRAELVDGDIEPMEPSTVLIVLSLLAIVVLVAVAAAAWTASQHPCNVTPVGGFNEL